MFAKAKKKDKNKQRWGPFLTDPSLFDQSEGTFFDNQHRRRVCVHLVPAPWSRVVLLSMVYALAVSFAQITWNYFFGRPQWFAADAGSVVSADLERADQDETTRSLEQLRDAATRVAE